MSISPTERRLRSEEAAHISWANTVDRTARTAIPRKAFQDKFLAEADGDHKRAESLRKAYFARLARESVKARRRRANGAVASQPCIQRRSRPIALTPTLMLPPASTNWTRGVASTRAVRGVVRAPAMKTTVTGTLIPRR